MGDGTAAKASAPFPLPISGLGLLPHAILGQCHSARGVNGEAGINTGAPVSATPKSSASARGTPPQGRPPPPKAPPRRAPPGRASGAGAAANASSAVAPGDLQSWRGPRPSKDWKALHFVNWQPIRQTERLKGSVWQQVQTSIENELECVPDGLFDGLNRAFMCKTADSANAVGRTSRSERRLTGQVVRKLPQQKALHVDVLHAQLVRWGVRSAEKLGWITGAAPGHQGTPEATVAAPPAIDVDVLEALLALLRGVEGEALDFLTEACVEDGKEVVLAPSEAFLRELYLHAGPLPALQTRVEIAVHMGRFSEKLAAIEPALLRCLVAVRMVTESRAIPVLLEGVLLVGNYVNASSRSLAGALGITLESLAKLAHTRGKGNGSGDSILHILAAHFQHTHPSFVESLAREFNSCCDARDVDPKLLETQFRDLTAHFRQVESLSQQALVQNRCEALAPARLEHFLTETRPKLEYIADLFEQLDRASSDLRRWFAEPPERRLQEMLQNLAALRGALPQLRRPSGRVPSSPKGASTARRPRQNSGGVTRQRSGVSLPVSGPASPTARRAWPPAPEDADATAELDFATPLSELSLALATLNAAGKETATDQFKVPLAELKGVLQRLNKGPPQSEESYDHCDENAETRAGSDELFDSDGDFVETQTGGPHDAFEAPLANLLSALATLQAPEDTGPPGWQPPADDDEEVYDAFDVPLADLESVLANFRGSELPAPDGSFATGGTAQHIDAAPVLEDGQPRPLTLDDLNSID